MSHVKFILTHVVVQKVASSSLSFITCYPRRRRCVRSWTPCVTLLEPSTVLRVERYRLEQMARELSPCYKKEQEIYGTRNMVHEIKKCYERLRHTWGNSLVKPGINFRESIEHEMSKYGIFREHKSWFVWSFVMVRFVVYYVVFLTLKLKLKKLHPATA